MLQSVQRLEDPEVLDMQAGAQVVRQTLTGRLVVLLEEEEEEVHRCCVSEPEGAQLHSCSHLAEGVEGPSGTVCLRVSHLGEVDLVSREAPAQVQLVNLVEAALIQAAAAVDPLDPQV